MLFGPNATISYIIQGNSTIHDCGFQRSNIFLGNGGVISVFSISFFLVITQCWFHSCVSQGSGACIYFNAFAGPGSSQIIRCCSSKCYVEEGFYGNFVAIGHKLSSNYSRIADCSIIKCDSDSKYSRSILHFRFMELEFVNNNVSSTYITKDHSINLYDVEVRDLKMDIFHELVTEKHSTVFFQNCGSVKSKFLAFLNISGKEKSSNVICIWETNILMENSSFINNSINICDSENAYITIKCSHIVNQLINNLDLITMDMTLNYIGPILFPFPYRVLGCFNGISIVPSRKTSENLFDLKYGLLLTIIVISIISVSVIYWMCKRIDVINDHILLNQSVVVDFG